jgi:transcriptional regulator with XRE-family HTH domain
MAAIKALVKPALLRWARDRAKLKPEDAAKAAHVSVERLLAWESDKDDNAPTLGQLRNLAAAYHFPLAVFYLPEPPNDFAPLRDFRRLPDAEEAPISANLAFHVRSAYEKRELALELSQELGSEPRRFPLRANLDDDPEKVGLAIRELLDADVESQRRAARQGRAFDYWRRRLKRATCWCSLSVARTTASSCGRCAASPSRHPNCRCWWSMARTTARVASSFMSCAICCWAKARFRTVPATIRG